ncbi:MAG TPA: pantoate--beta-alanine ligase [Bacillota bacterium]|nr:pantoate--beta-alanine ligase [Bacillota bacterium]HOB86098.1 pantoate--beta-alanine ligase [Bacillota bacterium]HOP68661.1 pantoate--beta-alanine ligase [Bacillota bacterium]HPT34216.1 pantoate--beta-alanine ligase [Bacillota bacterium]HQD07007.1 pantoate--beta-alanine ligase [Bacillota bacterium]
MEVVTAIEELRRRIREVKAGGASIGFVPTMGFLHQGHLSLMERARRENDFLVISIFVNPLQFGRGEDLDRYPRDREGDLAKARKVGCDLVFFPEEKTLYPPGFTTYVQVEGLSSVLCGVSRPTHFRGVATVVNKLFNLVQPDRAYFGQKDAQQAILIKRMVADLNMNLEVVVCPTVREEDGLAMSSRNNYLTPQERRAAPVLYRALKAGEELIAGGERSPRAVVRRMEEVIAGEPLVKKVDYLVVVDAENLQEKDPLEGSLLLAGAVYIGKARLIDNIIVNLA